MILNNQHIGRIDQIDQLGKLGVVCQSLALELTVDSYVEEELKTSEHKLVQEQRENGRLQGDLESCRVQLQEAEEGRNSCKVECEKEVNSTRLQLMQVK